MADADVVERLERLEDLEAIRDLQARYAVAVEREYDGDAVAELFTENGVWSAGGVARVEGRAAIGEFFSAPGRHRRTFHYFVSPVIDVADDRSAASSTWYLLMATAPDDQAGGHGRLTAAVDTILYARQDGRWLISELSVDVQFVAGLELDAAQNIARATAWFR